MLNKKLFKAPNSQTVMYFTLLYSNVIYSNVCKRAMHRSFKQTYLFPVIPASVIHPLAQQFNGRLGSICFQHGHVQIINEEDEIFSQRRPKHTLTPVRYINSK